MQPGSGASLDLVWPRFQNMQAKSPLPVTLCRWWGQLIQEWTWTPATSTTPNLLGERAIQLDLAFTQSWYAH